MPVLRLGRRSLSYFLEGAFEGHHGVAVDPDTLAVMDNVPDVAGVVAPIALTVLVLGGYRVVILIALGLCDNAAANRTAAHIGL